MNKSEQIQRLKADSISTMETLQKEALARRFLVGAHNGVRLKKSLAVIQRLDLEGRTLLTPDVHKAHADKLSKRYETILQKLRLKSHNNWSKIPKPYRLEKPTDTEIAGNYLRFLTLVDSVTVE